MSKFAIRKPTIIRGGKYYAFRAAGSSFLPLSSTYITGADVSVTLNATTLSDGDQVTFEMVEVGVGTYDTESGLTLTQSFTAGNIEHNTGLVESENASFACELTWPSTFNSDGVIFAKGGSGTGTTLSLESSGSLLQISAGEGGSSVTSNDGIVASVSTNIFTPGSSGTLSWDLYETAPARARVFWNGALIIEEFTTGGDWEAGSWAGTGDGTYGGPDPDGTNTGSTTIAFPGTLNSDLRYYRNQLITNFGDDFTGYIQTATVSSGQATTTFTSTIQSRSDTVFQIVAKDSGGNTIATSQQFTLLGPTFAIAGDTVNEGDNITVNVTANNVVDGATFYLTSNVPAADITGDGIATITENWTTGQITGIVFDAAKEDAFTEGNETFEIYLKEGSATGTTLATGNFTIVDTSKIISVTADKSTMTENDTVTFTITAQDYTGNLTATVSNSNVTGNDFTSGTLTYNVSISGGTGTLAITTKEDGVTEGSETFDVVFTNSDGQAVATSPTITITDSSTIAVTQDTTSINEGDTVTFTLTGTNFDSGTITATVAGTVTADDFTSGTLTHNITMSGGTGTLALTPIGDADSDGTETFTVTFTNADGNVVATSPTITVNDTSTVTGTSLSATSVNEGDTVTVTVNTQNAADGITLYYDTELVSGNFLNPSDFADSSLEGSFTITSNSGSFTRTFASDGFTEGLEQFRFNIRSGSSVGPIQATTGTIDVADTSTGVAEPTGPANANADDAWTIVASSTYSFAAMEDNTVINVNGTPSLTLTSAHDVNILSLTAGDVITSTSPISFSATSEEGTGISHAWAGTLFAYGTPRDNPIFYIKAIGTDANVTVVRSNTTTVFSGVVTSSAITEVALGTSLSGYVIESDNPIAVYVRGSNSSDMLPIYPASTEIYGMFSQNDLVVGTVDGTTVNYYETDGTTGSFTINKGGYVDNLPTASSQYNSPAIKLVADNPIGAIGWADADGGEATPFIDAEGFGNKFVIPENENEWVVFISDKPANLTFTQNGSTILTATLSGSTNGGGIYWYRATGSNASQGVIITSDEPVYGIFEGEGDNETILMSHFEP